MNERCILPALSMGAGQTPRRGRTRHAQRGFLGFSTLGSFSFDLNSL
jgi:hypothetical protein